MNQSRPRSGATGLGSGPAAAYLTSLRPLNICISSIHRCSSASECIRNSPPLLPPFSFFDDNMICTRCLLRLARRTLPTTTARTFSHTPSSLTASQPTSSPSESAATAGNTAKHPPSSVPAGTVLKGLNFLKNHTDPVAMPDEDYPPWLWSVLSSTQSSSSSPSSSSPDGGASADGDLFCKRSPSPITICLPHADDLTAKSKKQRRKAAKALRKQALLDPESLAPRVPVDHQTCDLPAGDGTAAGAIEAARARREVTHAMRERRRKKIKEDNFLSRL